MTSTKDNNPKSQKQPSYDSVEALTLPKSIKTPEEEFGFDLSELQQELDGSKGDTYIPNTMRQAFAARGYDLQYVNYSNSSEWNRRYAQTKGAVRPVTKVDIENFCGDANMFGLFSEKTDFGGKAISGVVRAGEMVLIMIPSAVSAILRKAQEERTTAARKQIYGDSRIKQANRFVRDDVMAADGTKMVQTVVRGPGGDSTYSAKDYNSFGD